jgi:hypothetical protein
MKDILEVVEHDILNRDLCSTGEKNRSQRKKLRIVCEFTQKAFPWIKYTTT